MHKYFLFILMFTFSIISFHKPCLAAPDEGKDYNLSVGAKYGRYGLSDTHLKYYGAWVSSSDVKSAFGLNIDLTYKQFGVGISGLFVNFPAELTVRDENNNNSDYSYVEKEIDIARFNFDLSLKYKPSPYYWFFTGLRYEINDCQTIKTDQGNFNIDHNLIMAPAIGVGIMYPARLTPYLSIAYFPWVKHSDIDKNAVTYSVDTGLVYTFSSLPIAFTLSFKGQQIKMGKYYRGMGLPELNYAGEFEFGDMDDQIYFASLGITYIF